MGRTALVVPLRLAPSLVLAVALPACSTSPAHEAAIGCDGGVSKVLSANVDFISSNNRCWAEGWTANKMGTAAAGDPCSKSSDCAPSCCSCGPLNGLNATAALCVNGICADVNTTCCAYAADYASHPSCVSQPNTEAGTD